MPAHQQWNCLHLRKPYGNKTPYKKNFFKILFLQYLQLFLVKIWTKRKCVQAVNFSQAMMSYRQGRLTQNKV